MPFSACSYGVTREISETYRFARLVKTRSIYLGFAAVYAVILVTLLVLAPTAR